MPVLGVGGVLQLRRELPEPVLLSPSAVAFHTNAINVNTEGFWTGDKVWVWGPRGLPFDLNGDGDPDFTGGWGMFFGSKYLLYGPRKARLTRGTAKWFGLSSEKPFARTTPGVDRTELFIYRDELDRLSFYKTFNGALAGSSADRLPIFNVDFRFLLLAPEGSAGYQQRLEPAYPPLTNYRLPESVTEQPLAQATTAALPGPTGLDDTRPWYFVGEMEDWSLELDANNIETTSLGERFGESTRALVTGGGQVNFFVNRFQRGYETDAMFLARLLITLEQGSKAEAIFKITNKQGLPTNNPNSKRIPISTVSYRAELLLVNTVTDTSADDVIRGSARFVTVGRVRLNIS